MASAFIVVLLVATGEAQDASTAMVAKTAQEGLDEHAIVVVRETVPKRLTNDEGARVGDALDASAVVVIGWRDERRTAVIHLRPDRRRGWLERTVTFADVDPTAERGKTIGFEVASMITVEKEKASSAEPIAPP